MKYALLRRLLAPESIGGVLLIAAALLAMLVQNSPAQELYSRFLSLTMEIRVGNFGIDKPLLLWINDGLMAIFFFSIGLEIKFEVMEGELSSPAKVLLPAVAALGGMFVPASIYTLVNHHDSVAMNGWAIPSATDIAFALGVLSLLGNRVPTSLKLFLMTLAIIDDLGAIIIIALFYTVDLSETSLLVASMAILVLFAMNLRGVRTQAPYLLVGMVLWAAVLKSGVHATLAGVVIALFIPNRRAAGKQGTQLQVLLHDLEPMVGRVILPLFAFANAGIPLQGFTLDSLLHPVPLGVAAGLFFGNQIGVFACTWLLIRAGLAPMPKGASWWQIYGVATLCGIGFTMSLFIGSLAFDQGGPTIPVDERLGILLGSTLSAAFGLFVLHRSSPAAITR